MRLNTSATAVLFEIMQTARITLAKSPPGTTYGAEYTGPLARTPYTPLRALRPG